MNNKNQKYIIISTVLLIAIIILVFFTKKDDNPTTSGTGTVSTKATSVKVVPDVTKGNADTTINANITFRDIDFSLTQEDVIKKEKNIEDTLDNPSIAESSDGYTYITFANNPDKPINYNGFSVSSNGTTCLTYVFKTGNLQEVRLQFGAIDDAETTGIIANINSQYGEYTFYRSTNDTETYWWKSNTTWLMLTSDSVGTTLFLRKV